METNINWKNDMSRRSFVEKLAWGTFGVSILDTPGFSADVKAVPMGRFKKAEHVIYIYMNGGMSHLDTFDPKTNTEINNGINPISTKGDFQISQYFPKLALHGDKFSVLSGMTSKVAAHSPGQYLMRTSYTKNTLTIHPAMGAISSWQLGKQHGSIPDNVLISGDSDHSKEGYLDKKFTPLPIVNPNDGLKFSKRTVQESVFNNRIALTNALDGNFRKNYNIKDVHSYTELYDETLKVLNSTDLDVFDLNKETAETRTRYGKDNFSQGLLLAKRIIASGVRFVEVDMGGFDNHVDISDRFDERAPIIDNAISALFEDLKSSGLLEKTLIVVATEFGRTPKINENKGRDHHSVSFSTMLGGLDIGGKRIGKTNDKGSEVIDRPINSGELNATIGHFLGIKHDLVYHSPSGRPFTTGNSALPIVELLS